MEPVSVTGGNPELRNSIKRGKAGIQSHYQNWISFCEGQLGRGKGSPL